MSILSKGETCGSCKESSSVISAINSSLPRCLDEYSKNRSINSQAVLLTFSSSEPQTPDISQSSNSSKLILPSRKRRNFSTICEVVIMSNPDTEIVVTPSEIRRLFNYHILPKINQGLLSAQVRASKHPSSPKAKEPFCTKSQFITYSDGKNQKVAWAHRYLREDGSLGASGKPDPKKIVLDGTTYIAKEEP